jgi:hypothetical protein
LRVAHGLLQVNHLQLVVALEALAQAVDRFLDPLFVKAPALGVHGSADEAQHHVLQRGSVGFGVAAVFHAVDLLGLGNEQVDLGLAEQARLLEVVPKRFDVHV